MFITFFPQNIVWLMLFITFNLNIFSCYNRMNLIGDGASHQFEIKQFFILIYFFFQQLNENIPMNFSCLVRHSFLNSYRLYIYSVSVVFTINDRSAYYYFDFFCGKNEFKVLVAHHNTERHECFFFLFQKYNIYHSLSRTHLVFGCFVFFSLFQYKTSFWYNLINHVDLFVFND